ncbi:MAG TPA: glycoside hydrolase family 13 protein, partial [Acidimicrobiia bacterium]|nr:glycoside hydrolase family 13 protein [Acidimicrobiia bacterium]
MMILGEQGHLRPYDVRFDPADAAYLSAYPDGALRLRLLTEAGFTEAAVNEADGHLVPMHRVARSTRFDVWEVRYVPRRRRFRYTFALRDADRRAVYLVPAGIGNAVERLDRWEIDLDDTAPLDVPEWARGAVIYQIFPERFADGDPSLSPDEAMPWGSAPHWLEFQGGDLVGIADKADHLAGLGVGMVYLNPIFRSPSTHRYDVIDYYEVDPALGGNDALRRLVGALHERDIKVIVDASFNHCHPQFFAFADVMEKGPASEYAAWFVVTDHPPRVGYRPDQVRARFDQADAYDRYIARFRDEAKMNVEVLEGEGPPVELTYEAWYGVPSLPRIDLTNPGARDYFLEVARHWVREYDVDGWRMDVARYVDFAFWPRFRQAVKEVRPDAYLIAEIMGDAMPWLQGDTFDATMNYTFRQLVLDFVADPVGGGVDFADGFVSMWGRYAPEVLEASQNLLGSHDKARFL